MRLPELLAPGVAARPDCGVLSTVRHSRYHSAFKGSLRARAAHCSLSFLNRDTAGPGYYRALLETSRPGQICCTHNITDLPSEIWTAKAERPSRGANGQFSASCLHLQHRCWCSRCLRTWRAATNSKCAGRDILEPRKLVFALQRIARQTGEEIDDARPYVDARLPDGSRVAAVIPPCSVGGPTVTIRKFQRQYFSPPRLIELGAFAVLDERQIEVPPGDKPPLPVNRNTADLLLAALAARQNILISGQPGAGKTSLQNALLNQLHPERDRVVLIEESAEMQIEADNVARLECWTTPGLPPVTIRDLVKIALRHRPDHLVIGEIRGAEAMDLLDALNTGNSGSMTTIHANSAASALTKLSNLALRADADIPHDALQAQIADVITYVVHMARKQDKRFVSEVVRIRAYDFQSKLFQYEQCALSPAA